MGRFQKWRSHILKAGFIVAVWLLLVVIFVKPATGQRKVEKWLGAKLPSSIANVHYWYYQVPGYYEANLFARFEVSKDDFISLMKDIGASKPVNQDTIQFLPANFNTDRSVTWWDPPQEQKEHFFLITKEGAINCVWVDGRAYIEKHGGFGSMWGHKSPDSQ